MVVPPCPWLLCMCMQDPSVHGSATTPPTQQQQPQQQASNLATAASAASQVSSAARSSLEGPHHSRSSLEGPGLSDAALRRCTLAGVKLVVQPGELLAVVGEVGAGKSSLLAALLGELMPVKGPDGAVHGEWWMPGLLGCQGARVVFVEARVCLQLVWRPLPFGPTLQWVLLCCMQSVRRCGEQLPGLLACPACLPSQQHILCLPAPREQR